ncbi:MAG: flagellar type III secretion system pore protein FliP [Treponemataceae bacterium]|nr:flagellar type III secretion system pore protein FliP [Treponemataceae bacterium]
MSGAKKRFFAISLIICLASSFLPAQESFPEGSTSGTTSMTSTVNDIDIPLIDLSIRNPDTNQEVAFSIQLMLLLTVLSLAPSILILVTCFLRFSIVLDFIKRALSLQQVPPTAVLNGIAFFMTLFIMWPTFTSMYDNSFKPMADGVIGLEEAYANAEAPLRIFMYKQMSNDTDYIELFMSMGGLGRPATLADVPTYVLVPAYILHELTVAFKIGILLYLPFIIIDMVVASILMSMGMIMLPPVQISMPFKLMVFVLVDGWGLLTQQLFSSIIP